MEEQLFGTSSQDRAAPSLHIERVNMIGSPPSGRPGNGAVPPCWIEPMSEDRMMLVAAAVFVTASVLLTLSLL
jgi:hypothetical protein